MDEEQSQENNLEFKPHKISHHHNSRAFLVLAVILLILLGGYIILSNFFSPLSEREERTYTEVDLRDKEGSDRLPPGFSSDIPVDLTTITEASSQTHRYGDVTQASVTYLSNLSTEEIIEGYRMYFEARNYEITRDEVLEESETYSFYGTDGQRDLSILVSSQEGTNVKEVHVTYVERKDASNE